MAITKTHVSLLVGTKVLVRNGSGKLYAFVSDIKNSIDPQPDSPPRNCIVKAWDAASVETATGDPLITAVLSWEAGQAQGFIPFTNGLVVQCDVGCTAYWGT